jgi:hypothetical protein
MTDNASGSSPLRLVAYWVLVLIPLGWGISRSVVTSLPLLTTTDSRVTSTSRLTNPPDAPQFLPYLDGKGAEAEEIQR